MEEYKRTVTSFYGSSCANNGEDALDTPGRDTNIRHQLRDEYEPYSAPADGSLRRERVRTWSGRWSGRTRWTPPSSPTGSPGWAQPSRGFPPALRTQKGVWGGWPKGPRPPSAPKGPFPFPQRLSLGVRPGRPAPRPPRRCRRLPSPCPRLRARSGGVLSLRPPRAPPPPGRRSRSSRPCSLRARTHS
eukprot:7086941-Pyramimonas_sp.AAC.1